MGPEGESRGSWQENHAVKVIIEFMIKEFLKLVKQRKVFGHKMS